MVFPERSAAVLRQEGRHARDRGEPESANPYPEGSEEYITWSRGWQQLEGEEQPRARNGDQS